MAGELKKQLQWSGNLLSGMGYTEQQEKLGIIFSDWVTMPITAGQKQMQLALERIAEIEQKQLDGMYNLPEGSTFWVPLGAMGLRPTAGGGGGTEVKEGGNLILRGAELFVDAVGRLMTIGSATVQSIQNASPLPKTRFGFTNMEGFSEVSSPKTRFGFTGMEGFNEISTPVVSPKTRFGFTGMEGFSEISPTTPLAAKVSAVGNAIAPIDTSPITRIQLEIKDNITLTVDGRQMANVVKQYLWEDMVRAEKSSGTIKRQLVV
jgi:hypothetical protein